MGIDVGVDELIYGCFAAFSIAFGFFYRQIKDKEQKKWTGTITGLLLTFFITGSQIWHDLIMFSINSMIILLMPKRYIHVLTFAITFLYLFFIRTTNYFGAAFLPFYADFNHMKMVLKLVGLAFEVNEYVLRKKESENNNGPKKGDILVIDITDIFHYSFSYLGVMSGPYYRYKTFVDHFNLPPEANATCNRKAFKQLCYVPIFTLACLLSKYFWPVSYALTNEFYSERSWLYRIWYSWPTFFSFRMRLYGGLLLVDIITIVVGLGAYPVTSEPKPGLGPTKPYDWSAIKSSSKLEIEKLDFSTTNNMNAYNADFSTTIRDGMKNWNMCIQYWLYSTVYKHFPIKKMRTSATMLTSAFWHGLYAGYYVCIASAPFYLAVEDLYMQIFLKDNKGWSLKIWGWILWFFKMQTLSYLSMGFHLMEFREVLRYYDSTYYYGFIGAAILYILGQIIKNSQSQRNEQKRNNPKYYTDEQQKIKIRTINVY